MTKAPNLQPKERQMLELLSQGASSRTIAKKMGYSEGTVRVYLHNLYKKIGVKNRTEALLWQLDHVRTAEARAGVAGSPGSATIRADETFGDVAVRDGLLATLGIMESFIGPYGRLWEVASRLKGEEPAEAALGRREEARTLWRALLQGAFAYAKGLHDEGLGEKLADESPPEAVLLALSLLIGGYSNAADGYVTRLTRARKGARAITAREANLLRAVRDAVDAQEDEGLATIHQIASEKGASQALRQVATVSLFHAYRLRKDAARACETANALWAEAEESRRQLEAMGIRPLAREAALPRPGRAPARQGREKVAAGG